MTSVRSDMARFVAPLGEIGGRIRRIEASRGIVIYNASSIQRVAIKGDTY
jgi:hypothetical protein